MHSRWVPEVRAYVAAVCMCTCVRLCVCACLETGGIDLVGADMRPERRARQVWPGTGQVWPGAEGRRLAGLGRGVPCQECNSVVGLGPGAVVLHGPGAQRESQTELSVPQDWPARGATVSGAPVDASSGWASSYTQQCPGALGKADSPPPSPTLCLLSPSTRPGRWHCSALNCRLPWRLNGVSDGPENVGTVVRDACFHTCICPPR